MASGSEKAMYGMIRPHQVSNRCVDRSMLNIGVTSEIWREHGHQQRRPDKDLLAPEAQPGDGVGGETRQYHRDKGGDQGDDDRVAQGEQEVDGLEDGR